MFILDVLFVVIVIFYTTRCYKLLLLINIMATSVLLSCSLNDAVLPNFIFIEEDSADSSFLVNCILHQRVKMQDTGTVLACLHQTYEHYLQAGLRLGYNLNMFKDRKSLRTIEPLKDLAETFIGSAYLDSSEIVINYFLETIMINIKELLTMKTKIIVIIDDLTFLINLGVEERAIFLFCQRLCDLTKLTNISIIVKLNTSNSYETLCNNIDDISNLKIKIEKLKSGNFKEVDGKITVIKKEDEQHDLIKPRKTVLYKVVDKAIKIFALGEIGVKI